MPAMPLNEKKKRSYHKTSETQKVIFEKAMAIMAEKGFQGTTVREICEAAGIPIGTFYNCYKSKTDILQVVYAEGDQYFDSFKKESENENAVTRLHLFGKYYAKLNISTGIDVMRVLFYPMNEWFASSRPMQKILLDIVRDGQERGELKKSYDAEYIVSYIFDFLRGVCYNWCIYNGEFDLTKRIDAHIDTVCRLLEVKDV